MKSIPLVGGPHDGERFRPRRDGTGIPQLVSMECELAGGFGKCRSSYELDLSEGVYRFRTSTVFDAPDEFPVSG